MKRGQHNGEKIETRRIYNSVIHNTIIYLFLVLFIIYFLGGGRMEAKSLADVSYPLLLGTDVKSPVGRVRVGCSDTRGED